ncbi:hypothetical protein GGI06_000414 [Coemansia sp. S85]|nr:hypothetical protein GGI06_000414 [Coemansia sp. S85]
MSGEAQLRESYTGHWGYDNYRRDRAKECKTYSLEAWAVFIFEWTGRNELWDDYPTSGNDSNGDGPKLASLHAHSAIQYYEAFFLFVTHHVKAFIGEQVAVGSLKPGDCRLILPVLNPNLETDYCGYYSRDYKEDKYFGHVECGMFPFGCSVEKQETLTLDNFVAYVEIEGYLDSYEDVEPMLVRKTKPLFFGQHNRHFAWGLAATCHEVYAHVFGPDDVWASKVIDVSGPEGRQTLISLLVNWSLCSVARLGFDPPIRYVHDGDPHPEIDVHNVDANTGHVEKRTYYSKHCMVAAESFIGRRARYFAASADSNQLDNLAVLIKDVWVSSSSDSASDMRESLVLNALHAEFGESSKLSDSFAPLAHSGPVFIGQGDMLVEDTTTSAFAGLTGNGPVRLHRRVLRPWVGNPISAATNQNQVVVAIADAMEALNAAYVKCNIVHGNISDQAIFLKETADGIKGVLAEFGYASFADDNVNKSPELKVFQFIRSLEKPGAVRTRLDDWESILYLACWLGTFGINCEQRAEHAKGFADEYTVARATQRSPMRFSHIPILTWSHDMVGSVASNKRMRMLHESTFYSDVLHRMRRSPLRDLAWFIHRALFLHPGIHKNAQISSSQLADTDDLDSSVESLLLLDTVSTQDSLDLRDGFEEEIVENLLLVVARFKKVALVAISDQ